MRGLQKVFLWVRALLNGSEMDHVLPGGVCEEVTVARHCWLCKSVQRQPCSGPMLAEVHLEVVTAVTR